MRCSTSSLRTQPELLLPRLHRPLVVLTAFMSYVTKSASTPGVVFFPVIIEPLMDRQPTAAP